MAPKRKSKATKTKSQSKPETEPKTPEDILGEYEQLRAQAETLKQRLELIGASLSEMEITKESLDNVEKLGKDNEILVPLGGDAFVKAQIIDTERVIVGIGSRVVVRKSTSEAKADMENKIREMEKIMADRNESLRRALKRLEELTPTVQRMVSKLSNEG